MNRILRCLVALAAFTLVLITITHTASAQASGPLPKDIRFEPHLGERVPLDVQLTDDSGLPRRLGDYLNGGRPVVLVLAYYECPMLCSMVLNGAAVALREGGLAAGVDFELVVISIDPSDTPERARAKKAAYVRFNGRPGAEQAFHFLVGDEGDVRRVANAVGFRYEYDPIGRQFAHPGGLVVLTPEGVVSRYLQGVDFSPRDLRLGLVEAANGKVGSAVDKVMLLCFRYDPERGRYGAIAMRSMRASGVATLLILGIVILFLSRRARAREAARRGGDEFERKP